MDPQAEPFLLAFPFLFISLWLAIGLVLALVAGWFRLRSRFPAPKGEAALLTLRGHSGSLGGVQYNGILDLSACAPGLKIAVWPIFGPFCRPILVPWDQIRTEPAPLHSIFFPHVRLELGRPEEGRLTIPTVLWRRLAEQATQAFPLGDSASDNWALARGLTILWVIISLLFGLMIMFGAGGTGQPLEPTFMVIPAAFFAITLGIHYLRLRRP